MVIREYYGTRADGVELFITKSTMGLKIRKIGTDEVYDEAVDVSNADFEYEETDVPIEDKP